MNQTNSRISVGHVLIPVADAEKSLEFYRCLGISIIGKFEGLVILELRGGTHILLAEFDPNQDISAQKKIDLMIDGNTRGELEHYRKSLVENGIDASAINAQPRFGHYYFSIKDPDGNQLLFNTSHEAKFWTNQRATST